MSVSKRTGRRTLLASDSLTSVKETYRSALPITTKKDKNAYYSSDIDDDSYGGVSSTTKTISLEQYMRGENDSVNLISTPMQLRPRKRLSAAIVDEKKDNDFDNDNKQDDDGESDEKMLPDSSSKTVAKTVSSLTKMLKIDFSYIKRINLFSNDFYTILKVKNINNSATTGNRFDISLKQNLTQLENYLDTEPKIAFEKDYNDRETIRTVVLLGGYVLSNNAMKTIYDTYLTYKYSDLYVNTARGIGEMRIELKKAYRKYVELEIHYQRIIGSKLLEIALGSEVNKIVKTVVKKRPSSLNRVLIHWNTNTDVSLKSLENYFEKYGPINGTVMCDKKPHCAMMEFASANSVIEAIQNEKFYQLTEIQKWTLNNEYKQKIAFLLNTMKNIENNTTSI
ncbi:BJDP [Buzura suppressaria nucleopolyhedrovirus]|uniref:BJDP n=1 Tax=Buzura suppressaria nuclear polyhedrosis virus TaxID=74320 RepID=W5VKK1_NPVBS|nr:BJDP [Buzura suppressaria nucleopolyhedrovirus]AHH82638.1 BJDP [Buzura suppressaria nucleopolyhedrovirus]